MRNMLFNIVLYSTFIQVLLNQLIDRDILYRLYLHKVVEVLAYKLFSPLRTIENMS